MNNHVNATLVVIAFAASSQIASAEQKTGLQAFVSTDIAVDPRIICSGFQITTLPSLGECPAGSVGIATCYQKYKVPQRLELLSSASYNSFQCQLDTENMEIYGDLECNYSRCLVTSEPVIFDLYFDGSWINDFIWD